MLSAGSAVQNLQTVADRGTTNIANQLASVVGAARLMGQGVKGPLGQVAGSTSQVSNAMLAMAAVTGQASSNISGKLALILASASQLGQAKAPVAGVAVATTQASAQVSTFTGRIASAFLSLGSVLASTLAMIGRFAFTVAGKFVGIVAATAGLAAGVRVPLGSVVEATRAMGTNVAGSVRGLQGATGQSAGAIAAQFASVTAAARLMGVGVSAPLQSLQGATGQSAGAIAAQFAGVSAASKLMSVGVAANVGIAAVSINRQLGSIQLTNFAGRVMQSLGSVGAAIGKTAGSFLVLAGIRSPLTQAGVSIQDLAAVASTSAGGIASQFATVATASRLLGTVRGPASQAGSALQNLSVVAATNSLDVRNRIGLMVGSVANMAASLKGPIAAIVATAEVAGGAIMSFGRGTLSVVSAISGGLIKATSFIGSFLKYTTFAFLGVGATAITMGQHAMSGIVETTKAAQRLQIGTEAMVTLQEAAKKSGVDLDGVTHALTKLAENISKAGAEGGDAAKAIASLGLDLKTLGTMNAADQFAAVSDKLKDVANLGDRARLTMELFGKSGIALLPTLSLGSEGLAKVREQADKLGLTFSASEGAGVMAAQKATAMIGKAWQGLGQTIAIAIAPYMDQYQQKIAEIITSLGNLVRGAAQYLPQFVDLVSAALGAASGMFQGLVSGVYDIIKMTSIALGSDSSNWASWGKSIKDILVDLTYFFKQWAGLVDMMQTKIAAGFLRFSEVVGKVFTLGMSDKTLQPLIDELDKMYDAKAKELGQGLADYRDKIAKMTNLPTPKIESTPTPMIAPTAMKGADVHPAFMDKDSLEAFKAITTSNREAKDVLPDIAADVAMMPGILKDIKDKLEGTGPLIPATL